MAKLVKTPTWNDRTIIHPNDADELERKAAVHEFQNKLPRHEAEHKAYKDYKNDKHREGAAHHLSGIKMAQGSGNMDEARKHGALYRLHLEALGHSAVGPVPTDIQSLIEKKPEKYYKFKAHKNDAFLLHQVHKKVHKSEDLNKGNLVQFPKDRVSPKKDLGQEAKVLPAIHKPVDKEAAKAHVANILGNVMETMSQDPGIQAESRKRDVEAKAQKLKMGGMHFKRGDKVMCSHQGENPGDCSYPWVGTVSGYEPNMSRDQGEHTYTVEWEHTPGRTGQGVHGQSELVHRNR